MRGGGKVNEYTAQQVSDILINEDPKMNLRTVRYYSQCGFIPDLVDSEHAKRKVYTDYHLAYFRAFRTMSKAGEKLDAIKEKLEPMSYAQLCSVGNEMAFYNTSRVLEHQTVLIDPRVSVVFHKEIDSSVRKKIIETVSTILKGE
jgi:DNA-binding transcriptional MerR regulator